MYTYFWIHCFSLELAKNSSTSIDFSSNEAVRTINKINKLDHILLFSVLRGSIYSRWHWCHEWRYKRKHTPGLVLLLSLHSHDWSWRNLKERSTQNWKFSHYLFIPILMECQVKFRSPHKTALQHSLKHPTKPMLCKASHDFPAAGG